MQAGANGNSPGRLELVRVADEKLVAELVGTDVGAWFGPAGEAFRSAHPSALYDAWEPVPGVDSGPHRVKAEGRYAAVLFCETRHGSPPFRVERDGDLTVVIDDSGCRIEGGRPRQSILDRLRRSKRVELSFAVPGEANGNRPVRVELVRLDDPDLVPTLARLSGSQWFGQARAAFRSTNPEVLMDDWELVPGSSYGPFRLGVNDNVHGVLFCGAAGRPLRVPWESEVNVEVGDRGCRLAGTDASRRSWNPLTWSAWE